VKFQKFVPHDRLQYVALLIINSFEGLIKNKETRYHKEIQNKIARQILKLSEVDGVQRFEMFLCLKDPLGSK
jgi:hypothetical protein